VAPPLAATQRTSHAARAAAVAPSRAPFDRHAVGAGGAAAPGTGAGAAGSAPVAADASPTALPRPLLVVLLASQRAHARDHRTLLALERPD
jgi:hypothetical protein